MRRGGSVKGNSFVAEYDDFIMGRDAVVRAEKAHVDAVW